MTNFLVDAAVVALAYIAALVLLFAAYRRADKIWLIKHSIITRGIGKRNIWRGEWGESVIVTFAAISALVVIFFTRDVSLLEVIRDWPRITTGLLIFVMLCVLGINLRTVLKAKKLGRSDRYVSSLRRTYRIYNGYCFCLFGMGAIIILMLAAQFQHDGAIFEQEVGRITAAFTQAHSIAARGDGSVLDHGRSVAQAEEGFSRIALAGKALQNQFNPLFIFAGTLIVINIAINLTKMKSMFTGDAVSMTALFTYGPLVIIGLIGLLVYLNVYEVMLTESLAQLRAMTPPANLGDWELSKRHAEMVVELSNARNIFGFAQTIAGEGGGFAILAWGIQTALEKIGENDDDNKEPLRMPLKRFRPDDGRVARIHPAKA